MEYSIYIKRASNRQANIWTDLRKVYYSQDTKENRYWFPVSVNRCFKGGKGGYRLFFTDTYVKNLHK